MNRDELSKFISHKIKLCRIEAGLTGETLGKKVGVGKTAIANYEAGRNIPKQEMLFKLAEVFEISIDDFFPSTKECKVDEITSILSSLNDVRRENVYIYSLNQYREQHHSCKLTQTTSCYGLISAGGGIEAFSKTRNGTSRSLDPFPLTIFLFKLKAAPWNLYFMTDRLFLLNILEIAFLRMG